MRHSITQVKLHEHGGTFKVTLRVAIKKGWIDQVVFYIWKLGMPETHTMDFVQVEDGYACFETTVDLGNNPLYQYYFSFFPHMYSLCSYLL